jgi:hypothetical protein
VLPAHLLALQAKRSLPLSGVPVPLGVRDTPCGFFWLDEGCNSSVTDGCTQTDVALDPSKQCLFLCTPGEMVKAAVATALQSLVQRVTGLAATHDLSFGAGPQVVDNHAVEEGKDEFVSVEPAAWEPPQLFHATEAKAAIFNAKRALAKFSVFGEQFCQTQAQVKRENMTLGASWADELDSELKSKAIVGVVPLVAAGGARPGGLVPVNALGGAALEAQMTVCRGAHSEFEKSLPAVVTSGGRAFSRSKGGGDKNLHITEEHTEVEHDIIKLGKQVCQTQAQVKRENMTLFGPEAQLAVIVRIDGASLAEQVVPAWRQRGKRGKCDVHGRSRLWGELCVFRASDCVSLGVSDCVQCRTSAACSRPLSAPTGQ